MKRFLIALSVFYFLLNACSEPNSIVTVNETQQPLPDTVRAALIDSFSVGIDKYWKEPDIRVVGLNDRDTVKYIELDGEPKRISSIFIRDSTLTWVVFHQENNELKLVRFREGRELPTRSVLEAFSYLENGKIFFSKERSKPLEPGEALAAFRFLEFVNNVRTPAELEAEYGKYWEISKKAVAEDLASRKK